MRTLNHRRPGGQSRGHQPLPAVLHNASLSRRGPAGGYSAPVCQSARPKYLDARSASFLADARQWLASMAGISTWGG